MNIALRLIALTQSFLRGEEGQDLVEYALLVSLIALAAISSISPVASAVTAVFSSISSSLA